MKKPFTKKEVLLILKFFLTLGAVFLGGWYFLKAFGALAFQSEGNLPNSYFWTLYLIALFVFVVFLSIRWPRFGGVLMLIDSVIIFGLFVQCLKSSSPLYIDPPTALNFFFVFSGPMIIFGISFLALGIFTKKIKPEDLQS